MPETSSDSLRCGKQHQGKQQHEKDKQPEELCAPPAPPSSPSPQPRESVPQTTSGSQVIPVMASTLHQCLLQQCWDDVEIRGQRQYRPSVLRQTTSRRQHENGVSQATSMCKAEVDTSHHPQSSSPPSGSSARQTRQHSSVEARLHDSMVAASSSSPVSKFSFSNGNRATVTNSDLIPGGASALFSNGFCRWPGCNATSEDFSSFLKHLHSEHGHGERSIAQWRVQQDMVQYMESQLILEKQKLFAMQLHLHLSEHKYTDLKAASNWPYSLPLLLPRPQAADGDGASRWVAKHPEDFAQHGYWASGSAHLLPDLVPSIDCYKYNNIRPPYTYAYLIRWSILESPDKQRTLNEIYNWFTTMFYYFRHNTATWKNAVRHNLSLHKCFVRVEGGKGAVWTVDETEYQRRKGQKFHRDCPVKWLTTYSHFCPEEP